MFRFEAERGPYVPGLQVLGLRDRSRLYFPRTSALGAERPGDRSRPLQTLVWYPATDASANRTTVADYLDLWASEIDFEGTQCSPIAEEWRRGLADHLERQTQAVRDAPTIEARFPLLIYAPSFSSVSWENADLCEYVASHGYVVIASPSLGAASRSMSPDIAGVLAQARDISFLIGYAASARNVDISRIAVAGFSWGGLANVFAAAADDRIKALIAFDGSIRYFPRLIDKSGLLRIDQLDKPLLSFAKRAWTLEEQARFLTADQMQGPNVLNAWTSGDLVAVVMRNMTHRQFSAMAQRNRDLNNDALDQDFPDRRPPDCSIEDGIHDYAMVALYTLKFLDAYLKADPGAAAFLRNEPIANGAHSGSMEIRVVPASTSPGSVDAFRAVVRQTGFAQIDEAYSKFREEHPGSDLPEPLMIEWADDLIAIGHPAEAQCVLRLLVGVLPESGNARAALAEMDARLGNLAEAAEGYRLAVSLCPFRPELRRKLAELERTGSQSGESAPQ